MTSILQCCMLVIVLHVQQKVCVNAEGDKSSNHVLMKSIREKDKEKSSAPKGNIKRGEVPMYGDIYVDSKVPSNVQKEEHDMQNTSERSALPNSNVWTSGDMQMSIKEQLSAPTDENDINAGDIMYDNKLGDQVAALQNKDAALTTSFQTDKVLTDHLKGLKQNSELQKEILSSESDADAGEYANDDMDTNTVNSQSLETSDRNVFSKIKHKLDELSDESQFKDDPKGEMIQSIPMTSSEMMDKSRTAGKGSIPQNIDDMEKYGIMDDVSSWAAGESDDSGAIGPIGTAVETIGYDTGKSKGNYTNYTNLPDESISHKPSNKTHTKKERIHRHASKKHKRKSKKKKHGRDKIITHKKGKAVQKSITLNVNVIKGAAPTSGDTGKDFIIKGTVPNTVVTADALNYQGFSSEESTAPRQKDEELNLTLLSEKGTESNNSSDNQENATLPLLNNSTDDASKKEGPKKESMYRALDKRINEMEDLTDIIMQNITNRSKLLAGNHTTNATNDVESCYGDIPDTPLLQSRDCVAQPQKSDNPSNKGNINEVLPSMHNTGIVNDAIASENNGTLPSNLKHTGTATNNTSKSNNTEAKQLSSQITVVNNNESLTNKSTNGDNNIGVENNENNDENLLVTVNISKENDRTPEMEQSFNETVPISSPKDALPNKSGSLVSVTYNNPENDDVNITDANSDLMPEITTNSSADTPDLKPTLVLNETHNETQNNTNLMKSSNNGALPKNLVISNFAHHGKLYNVSVNVYSKSKYLDDVSPAEIIAELDRIEKSFLKNSTLQEDTTHAVDRDNVEKVTTKREWTAYDKSRFNRMDKLIKHHLMERVALEDAMAKNDISTIQRTAMENEMLGNNVIPDISTLTEHDINIAGKNSVKNDEDETRNSKFQEKLDHLLDQVRSSAFARKHHIQVPVKNGITVFTADSMESRKVKNGTKRNDDMTKQSGVKETMHPTNMHANLVAYRDDISEDVDKKGDRKGYSYLNIDNTLEGRPNSNIVDDTEIKVGKPEASGKVSKLIEKSKNLDNKETKDKDSKPIEESKDVNITEKRGKPDTTDMRNSQEKPLNKSDNNVNGTELTSIEEEESKLLGKLFMEDVESELNKSQNVETIEKTNLTTLENTPSKVINQSEEVGIGTDGNLTNSDASGTVGENIGENPKRVLNNDTSDSGNNHSTVIAYERNITSNTVGDVRNNGFMDEIENVTEKTDLKNIGNTENVLNKSENIETRENTDSRSTQGSNDLDGSNATEVTANTDHNLLTPLVNIENASTEISNETDKIQFKKTQIKRMRKRYKKLKELAALNIRPLIVALMVKENGGKVQDKTLPVYFDSKSEKNKTEQLNSSQALLDILDLNEALSNIIKVVKISNQRFPPAKMRLVKSILNSMNNFYAEMENESLADVVTPAAKSANTSQQNGDAIPIDKSIVEIRGILKSRIRKQKRGKALIGAIRSALAHFNQMDKMIKAHLLQRAALKNEIKLGKLVPDSKALTDYDLSDHRLYHMSQAGKKMQSLEGNFNASKRTLRELVDYNNNVLGNISTANVSGRERGTRAIPSRIRSSLNPSSPLRNLFTLPKMKPMQSIIGKKHKVLRDKAGFKRTLNYKDTSGALESHLLNFLDEAKTELENRSSDKAEKSIKRNQFVHDILSSMNDLYSEMKSLLPFEDSLQNGTNSTGYNISRNNNDSETSRDKDDSTINNSSSNSYDNNTINSNDGNENIEKSEANETKNIDSPLFAINKTEMEKGITDNEQNQDKRNDTAVNPNETNKDIEIIIRKNENNQEQPERNDIMDTEKNDTMINSSKNDEGNEINNTRLNQNDNYTLEMYETNDTIKNESVINSSENKGENKEIASGSNLEMNEVNETTKTDTIVNSSKGHEKVVDKNNIQNNSIDDTKGRHIVRILFSGISNNTNNTKTHSARIDGIPSKKNSIDLKTNTGTIDDGIVVITVYNNKTNNIDQLDHNPISKDKVSDSLDSNATTESDSLDSNRTTDSDSLDSNRTTESDLLDSNRTTESDSLDSNRTTESDSLDSNRTTENVTSDSNEHNPVQMESSAITDKIDSKLRNKLEDTVTNIHDLTNKYDVDDDGIENKTDIVIIHYSSKNHKRIRLPASNN